MQVGLYLQVIRPHYLEYCFLSSLPSYDNVSPDASGVLEPGTAPFQQRCPTNQAESLFLLSHFLLNMQRDIQFIRNLIHFPGQRGSSFGKNGIPFTGFMGTSSALTYFVTHPLTVIYIHV